MAQDIGTVYVQVMPSGKGFGKSIEGDITQAAESGSAKGSGSIISKLGGAFGKIGKIGLGAVATIGGGITALTAKGGFDRALNIENAQAKLKGLGHDSASVTEIMNDALASVKGTAFGLGDAATVAATLSASGIKEGDQLTNVLKTVADTAQISGRSLTDIGNIFSSVAARGKLQGDDLLQLTSSGIPVLQLLGSKLGKTSEEISAMVSAGQIDFQTFADAMQEGLGGAALSAGDTFTGALANVKAALGRLGEKFETPALESLRDTFNKLIPLIDAVAEKVSPLADTMDGKLGNSVSTVAPFIERLTNALNDGSISLEDITKNVGLFVGGLAGLATVGGNVGPIVSIFDQLGSAGDKGLGMLTAKVRQVPGQLSSTLSGVQNFGMLFNKDMREALTMDGDPFANALNRIGKGFEQLSTPFKQFGSKLADTGIGQKIGGMASQVSTGFGKLTSTVDSNARMFASKFGGMFDSLGSKIGGSKIGQAFSTITGNVKSGFSTVTGALGNVFGGIGDIVGPSIQSGLGKIGGMFASFFNPANFMKFFGLAAIVAALIAGLGALDTSMGGQLTTMITTFFAKLPTYIAQFQAWVTSQLPTLIQSGMQLLQSVIQGITTSLPDILTAAVTVLTTLVDGLASNLPTLIPVAMQMITTLVQGIVGNLPQIVESGLNLLTQFVQGIVNAIPQLVAALPQIITSFVNGVLSLLPRILETGVNLLLKFINGIVNAIPQLVAALPQIISGFVNGIATHLPRILETGITLLGRFVAGIISAIPQIVAALPQIISAIWNGITSVDWIGLGLSIIRALANGIAGAVGQVMSAIGNVKDSILGFFGGAGSWLVGAGSAIINGLLGGLQSAFSGVMDFVSGIGDWIKEHKGPLPYDRRLLIPAGAAIMAGLNTSLQDGWKDVQRTVGSMNAQLQNGFQASAAVGQAAGTAGVVSGSRQFTVNQTINNPDARTTATLAVEMFRKAVA